ncbi:D-glycero-beta-D-manno-heptose 1-phosphate adenylyltransferase [Aquisphaera insulae]|uniref:D-glycero-beta-D-manno-heptose 1-phosphate adenylyltransferase n=1 Tax=Aquisphaera insulae TaxID=2712864 RepID=UPI0013ECC0CF|nr:D-glycero-beta-D-manno-heptose 1-phosphate adenylyltransferase [Aquisphaera insulae]
MSTQSHKLEALIRGLRPCKVAVIGDVMLDHYCKGNADRLSPEAPIQVLDVTDEFRMPGGAANVAMKVVGLESKVRMVGLVGDDATAGELQELLAADAAVTDSLVRDPARSTTMKTRFIAHNQQLLRVDREHRAAPSGWVREKLVREAFTAASEADAVILEDYGKGVLSPEVIAAAIRGARKNGAPVVVDPTGRNYSRYAGSTVLTPNLKEASVAAERPITDAESLEAVAHTLVEQTGSALAITREAEGISLFRRDVPRGPITHTHVPTMPVAVFDVTGAGDAVAASLAIALASGIEMADACALANLAGRAVVRQFGVGTISPGHLLAEANREQADWMVKTANVAAARQRSREIQQAGGKVVFTNGCFDILHYGHAHLLQFARSQGDFLILGLNTDASVRRFKGPTRPYVSEDQRAYMLSLYPFVDLIVLFDDDTPMNLIEAIRPDVLVKGGDYTPDTVVGRDVVESRGGKVVICPRLEGLSTTDLVRKIQDRIPA